MRLSKAEEQLMKYLWKLEKAFMKDLLEAYPEPKPAITTIATMLKRMKDKAIIDYKVFGNSREYYPLISKAEYFKKHFQSLIHTFFGDSTSTFASFFTKTADLSKEELQELKSIIDQEIEKKK
jgi:predicted transcriptional regulator